MDETPHSRFLLPDRSYQAIVRSELKKMAESAGFTGHRLGEVEIIIAEITSNLVKHATRGGELLARPVADPEAGMEIIAIDKGPGMSRPLKMMEDGHSTSKTLGQGLGAIRRLSDVFDLYSLPKWGTILYSCFFLRKKSKIANKSLNISVINVCKKNEIVSGDLWAHDMESKIVRIAMIDGLGHGKEANLAAREAVNTFLSDHKSRPVEQLRAMHDGLKKTRGAVITVAYIDEKNSQVIYSGVGNITMKLVSPVRSQGCVSYNGIVGHIMPNSLNNHSQHFDHKNDVLIMHSDGLSARWDLQKYPGILKHHGKTLCAALYKDFNRDNDDSTILVVKPQSRA